jgi:hypothetical protein
VPSCSVNKTQLHVPILDDDDLDDDDTDDDLDIEDIDNLEPKKETKKGTTGVCLLKFKK